MAASRRSPNADADDPNCGGGGANSSMAPQHFDGIEAYSPPASPPSAHPSGQPRTSSLVNQEASDAPTIGAASSSAQGPDAYGDAKMADKIVFPFLPGPRVLGSPTVAWDSDDDGDSRFGFSDRTSGGASTSTSSPDSYDYGSFFGYPLPHKQMQKQILEHYFWSNKEARDDVRASTSTSSPDTCDHRTFSGYQPSYEEMNNQIMEHSFWRRKEEARDYVSMILRTSQNGRRKINEKEPLSSLESEFDYQTLKDKANMLLANYSAYRKVDGDGSCFYRSFIYSYLEQLVEVSPDEEEEVRLLSALEPMLKKFQRLHWPDPYPDAHNAFVDLIIECMGKRKTLSVSDYQDWLFQESQNEQKFAKILSYLRLVTAVEVCSEPEKFRHVITELDPVNPDLVGFCRESVIPMHKDAEEFHGVALTDVLRVPLRTVIVDISGTIEPNTHIIHPESPLRSVPSVTLLYRPGHYDIIYK